MSCINELLNGGITLGCDPNTGGVRKIYITDSINVSSVTENADEVITAIGMVSGTTYYDFQFNKNTSSYEENIEVNLENGSTVYNQSVNLVIPRREWQKRNTIALLAVGQKKLSIIVEDSNGLFWLFGRFEGMQVTEMTGGSGVVKTDLNGYTITFTGAEGVQAFEVDATVIPTIV
jgi:hypothetical protein